ncbi:hypothetical protein EDD16DRAFT_69470 [Pisolithus croceorrhizus]|nr:hypothetical protein EDD16DRAFT_69470 [Pisolithus croceorrhizus]KAI6127499.1 hypothetical protein EV401DRAFT_984098 [Pisolithus croceorrhizus]KAI6149098.1 hypothetical protein EDD17DRAFT_1209906 [Pisolithus thermaeus]
MKDLFDARAELTRLQSRELELFQEFLDIRKAIEAQKAVIEELVKARAVPCIDRLPNELFVQICLLTVYSLCPTRLDKAGRARLASVSRRWRAVILDTPSFWSEINLGHYYEFPGLLKLHLERSHQVPLTVSVDEDLHEPDIISLYVNRIRVLQETTLGNLDRFACFTFPALEDLHVDLQHNSVDRILSMFSRAPALKCLRLERLNESFLTESLTIGYLGNNSLTRLSLTGRASWKVPQDSIHFPVLESLTLYISDPMSFLEAIVVPKLKCFEFSQKYNERPIYRAFRGLTSKFDNVHHFVLSPPSPNLLFREALYLTMEICQVFRGVRHANIHTRFFPPFFHTDRPDHYSSPINNWPHLESLEIQGFTAIEVRCWDSFLDWFVNRRNFGQHRLHLKLVGGEPTCRIVQGTLQTLQEYCVSLELYRIPLHPHMYLSASADSLLLSSPLFGQTNLAALVQTCPAATMREKLWALIPASTGLVIFDNC